MTAPNGLKYVEDLRGPVNKSRIQASRSVWKVAYGTTKKLAFTQAFLVEVMAEVEALNRTKWGDPMPSAVLKNWKTSLAKQFRAMARHLSQALSTNKQWAWEIVNGDREEGKEEATESRGDEAAETGEEEDAEGDEEEDAEGDGEGDEEEEAEEEPEDEDEKPLTKAAPRTASSTPPPALKPCLKKPAASAAGLKKGVVWSGFDVELGKAWRMLPGKPKEWSDEDLIIPEGAKDSDVPLARFPNGDTEPVKGLTVKQARLAIELKKRGKNATAVKWEKERVGDKMKLAIKRKPDRTPLLILYELAEGMPERQKRQVALKTFGDVDLKDL